MFEFIAVSWFLTLGWVPLQEDYVGYHRAVLDDTKIATVAELGLNAKFFDRLTLSGSMENYQYIGQDTNAGYFLPFRIDYKASANLKITDNVSINAYHECDHPVVTNSRDDLKSVYRSSETIISVTIRGGDF